MSIARVTSFAFAGVEAMPVEVQVQVSSGLPAFLVVGLPDKAVAEARERVRAALTAMGLALPPRRVLINLAPADLLKEGSHFDLPIALAVLAAMEVLPREELAGYAALGELSLDGTLNPVTGVLPAAIGASERGLGLICPAAQGGEAAWAGRVEVLALPDLLCAVNHFRGTQVLSPPDLAGVQEGTPGPDLSEVKGMETAKRALEIAAAGGHNLLRLSPIKFNVGDGSDADDLAVLARTEGPFVDDLRSARAGGVLVRCQACHLQTSLDLDRAAARGWGGLRLTRIPRSCPRCGSGQAVASIRGRGWAVDGLAMEGVQASPPAPLPVPAARPWWRRAMRRWAA